MDSLSSSSSSRNVLRIAPATIELRAMEPARLERVTACECGAILSLSQPDEDDDGRLIGYCEDCRGLYLLLERDGTCFAYMLPGDPAEEFDEEHDVVMAEANGHVHLPHAPIPRGALPEAEGALVPEPARPRV
jgi:hypothetical protein